jgi:YD repeat-containing protein
MLSSWLAFVACVLFASAAVDATTYVYDANGRLVTVTNDNGESARYVYDVMGNMVRIERIAADELKIFAFTPTHGTVEAPVTIYGQGFSSQISDNTVTFNGTVATIQSATANQLKVTVPFGATTGALAVKVAARSGRRLHGGRHRASADHCLRGARYDHGRRGADYQRRASLPDPREDLGTDRWSLAQYLPADECKPRDRSATVG